MTVNEFPEDADVSGHHSLRTLGLGSVLPKSNNSYNCLQSLWLCLTPRCSNSVDLLPQIPKDDDALDAWTTLSTTLCSAWAAGAISVSCSRSELWYANLFPCRPLTSNIGNVHLFHTFCSLNQRTIMGIDYVINRNFKLWWFCKVNYS